MNFSSILSLSVTAVIFGVSNTALHGNPAELPFGLESDMDLEAVVEHLESNSEFEETTPVIEYDSLGFKTTQEFNGVMFERLNVFFLSGPDVGGIFRVDLNSNLTENGQEAYDRIVQVGRYFQKEGLQSEINRFGELETFGDLVNRVVLEYSEKPTTIHINSRVGKIGDESGYMAQISWFNNNTLSKIEEVQSSPTSLLETYYSILEGEMYFVAELLCTRAGRLELDNWKSLVSELPDLADLLYEFEVEEVTNEGTTATATISTPGSPFAATLKQVNGLWKVSSALGFD